MNINLVPLVTFAAVLVIVMSAYWLFIDRPETRARLGVRRRLRRTPVSQVARVDLEKEAEPLSSVPTLNRILEQRETVLVPLRRLIDQSGAKVTVGTILLATACLFLAAFLLLSWLTRNMIGSLVLATVAGTAPTLWLKWLRTRRIRQFEEIFPEAIDLITRALRAGHAFTTGISMVATEIPEPVAGEFKLLYDRQNYGYPLADALRDFANRIPVIDARFFVTAVLTQREAGGNLSEVLDNLASVIRDRVVIKREVRAKSAHGRITGWVLAGLPPVMAAIIFILNPENMLLLFRDPIGIRMIILALVLQVIGTLIVRKLVDIEY
jgi:tight adherence protein B